MSKDGLLAASGRLIQQNLHLVEEAEKERKKLIGAYLRPWRWRRIRGIRKELDVLIARIEDNADRIDSIQKEAARLMEVEWRDL